MVAVLLARMPELEWHLEHLKSTQMKALPRELFKNKSSMTFQDCIEDIRFDLSRLSKLKVLSQAQYLSNRIHEKITVLVKICRLASTRLSHPSANMDIHEMVSYQQWAGQIELRLSQLSAQKVALEAAVLRLEKDDTKTILTLKQDIGFIEREITQLKERLAHEFRVL